MSSTIASVATVQFPTATLVLRTAWCPDKDLFVVFSRASHQTRMTLYKMQGAKKWEIAIQPRNVGKLDVDVTSVAWSPDAQFIAVISNPPHIAVHSIQDGSMVNEIPFSTVQFKIVNVWWFREEKTIIGNGLPDIFKRGDNITGSALAILKSLPLLDPIQDDTKPLNSNDLFAFHTGRARAAQTTRVVPPSIGAWPGFPRDLEGASIASNTHSMPHAFPEAADEPDDTNLNSVLAVADDSGQIHMFMEGSYLLGTISTVKENYPRSLYKFKEFFFAHMGPSSLDEGAVAVMPYAMKIPYLNTRHCRDVARVSTASRELAAYILHVVKDMRDAWFGTETQGGARDLGPKWLQSLEARQAKEFGQEDPYALLDLTCLLTTGRSSEALMDYLGSGEHMSERSLQKWETTMTDALVKLRDVSEKRAAPALQRLHLLLQEVQGWGMLPQYAVCQFKLPAVEECLEYAASAIVQCNWLAAAARKELLRFREFMKWIRHESGRSSTTGDAARAQHDILEVNDYLTSSLAASAIDKWFVGPGARISRATLGVPATEPRADIRAAVAKARAALARWDETVQEEVRPRDLSHVERNLDALVSQLATRCQEVFMEACMAAARSAVLLAPAPPEREPAPPPPPPAGDDDPAPLLIRERTVLDEHAPEREPGKFTFLQHLAIRPPHDVAGRPYLCLVRADQGPGHLPGKESTVEVCVLECRAPPPSPHMDGQDQGQDRDGGEGGEGGGESEQEPEPEPFDVLDVEFFDASLLVVVYRFRTPTRPRSREGQGRESEPEQGPTVGVGGDTRIATVGYANLLYHTLPAEAYVNGAPREALMRDVLARVASGELPPVPVPIMQSQSLGAGWAAAKGVRLAVNGRAGRRVVAVVDEGGMTLEVLDMEAVEEDEEDDEEADENEDGDAEGEETEAG